MLVSSGRGLLDAGEHRGLARFSCDRADEARRLCARARAHGREQIEARGVRDPRDARGDAAVPRHLFVPARVARAGLRRPPAARSATARRSRSPTSWPS